MDGVCYRTEDGRIQGNPAFNYPDRLLEQIRQYYKPYYEHFGIRGSDRHVARRLREESTEADRLNQYEILLNRRFEGGRSLVVGLGSGGLGICLHTLGNSVYGVEPNVAGLRIAQAKLAYVGGDARHFVQGVAETLPYATDTFDSVFCFTVLEHVRDVQMSLHEMVRVLKPGGVFVLSTPDYRFPLEQHYKVPVLLKPLPRVASAAILRAAGKPAKPLFDEITYVTSKQVQHMLMEIPGLRFFRVFESYPADWREPSSSFKFRLINSIFRFWARRFEIYPNQEYFIFKSDTHDRMVQD